MKKIKFHDGWFFRNGSRGFGTPVLGADDIPVTLPHDASIETKRNPDEPAGGGNGFFHEGNYVYTKKYVLDETKAGCKFYLEFEGVYQNAAVYINKSFAGRQYYGYGNFYVDATGFLKLGENIIQVEVKNGVPSGRWYTGGGIYRDVNLMIAQRIHIAADGVRIRTLEADEELAVLQTEVMLEHSGLGNFTGTLALQIFTEEGELVTENRQRLTLAERSVENFRQRMYVRNPKLWDADNPKLYRYRALLMEETSLSDEENMLDEEEGTFGIRTLRMNPFRGFQINGRSIKLRGGCLHHDNGILGAAEFLHAEECRVRKLKAAGYNAVRSSHYPMSRKLLEACDRYGMYVLDEISDVWTSGKVDFDYAMHMPECWEKDIHNMVQKDYNHPSVILYSIGNEILEVGNPLDSKWGKKMAELFHSLDDSRFVTNGINVTMGLDPFAHAEQPTSDGSTQPNEINNLMNILGADLDDLIIGESADAMLSESAAYLDITGYNYAAVRYERDLKIFPDRMILGTEAYPGDLDKNWKLVEKYPHVIGDFSWACWDYLGEAGIGRIGYEDDENYQFFPPYPCKAAYCGDFNLIGDRRPVSYWREIIWGGRTDPYIAVRPPIHHGVGRRMTNWSMTDAVRSWNHNGYEDMPVTVEVYGRGQEAALFLNGELLERKIIGEEKEATTLFETIYRPGKLEAVLYDHGVETGRDILETAGDGHLTAKADRSWIPAYGVYIAYIDIFLQDESGRLNPEQIKNVSISIDGPGKIQGFGSADPDSEENYFDRTARTWQGRLWAAVRGTGEKGRIILSLMSEDKESVQIEIMAKEKGEEKNAAI